MEAGSSHTSGFVWWLLGACRCGQTSGHSAQVEAPVFRLKEDRRLCMIQCWIAPHCLQSAPLSGRVGRAEVEAEIHVHVRMPAKVNCNLPAAGGKPSISRFEGAGEVHPRSLSPSFRVSQRG
jgi:hypothetical protein